MDLVNICMISVLQAQENHPTANSLVNRGCGEALPLIKLGRLRDWLIWAPVTSIFNFRRSASNRQRNADQPNVILFNDTPVEQTAKVMYQ